MMLGTMWYLLFNVIAGAPSIPSELFEAAQVYKLSLVQRWKTFNHTGIFFSLIIAIIKGVGGDWNASIVSEYVQLKGEIITISGLGETTYQATISGNFPGFLAATSVMSLLVVVTKRLVWLPLDSWEEKQYQLLV